MIHQPLYWPALYDMFLYNLRDIIWCYMLIKGTFRIDSYNWRFSAKTITICLYYLDLIGKSSSCYLVIKGLTNLCRSRGLACRPTAYKYM